jgi:transposase
MSEAYDGPQVVGMDLHRRRSVLVRMTADGRKLETARITNSPAELRRVIARAGKRPKVVLEATYGWYWAADTLAAAGAQVHLAHPLNTKGTQTVFGRRWGRRAGSGVAGWGRAGAGVVVEGDA